VQTFPNLHATTRRTRLASLSLAARQEWKEKRKSKRKRKEPWKTHLEAYERARDKSATPRCADSRLPLDRVSRRSINRAPRDYIRDDRERVPRRFTRSSGRSLSVRTSPQISGTISARFTAARLKRAFTGRGRLSGIYSVVAFRVALSADCRQLH